VVTDVRFHADEGHWSVTRRAKRSSRIHRHLIALTSTKANDRDSARLPTELDLLEAVDLDLRHLPVGSPSSAMKEWLGQ
jgi:hypothetical protein